MRASLLRLALRPSAHRAQIWDVGRRQARPTCPPAGQQGKGPSCSCSVGWAVRELLATMTILPSCPTLVEALLGHLGVPMVVKKKSITELYDLHFPAMGNSQWECNISEADRDGNAPHSLSMYHMSQKARR